jgi:hypothetical protein
MKILINRGNVVNAKSYPYWEELIALLKSHEIKEIKGILKEQEIIDLVNWSDVWISIDSFLPHLCKYYNLKNGIVLWGKSNPQIFGYSENVNILKSILNLRPDQFGEWKNVPNESKDWTDAYIVFSKALNMRKH